MTDPPRFTEGPPRTFMPISSLGPQGWTFGGRMGYEKVADKEGGQSVRHLCGPLTRFN